MEKVRIVRRLYYKQFDGPDAQITDPAALTAIANSGLEAVLDEAVIARVQQAHLFAGIDRWAGLGQIGGWRWRLSGAKIYGSTELFANHWLHGFTPDLVSPGKYADDIAHAASVGDVIQISKLLRTRQYSEAELNRALNFAVMSLWDNTPAIALLIRAGADVNAKFGDDYTPLMLTYESSCNVPILLEHGARVDDRNKWGQTALDLAVERHDIVAMRLLETQRRNQK